MKKALFLIMLICTLISYSQTAVKFGGLFVKEYNKEQALYLAKEFLMKEVIGVDTGIVKFKIDVLSGSTSGELTALVYICEQKKLQGLVLGFFGNKQTDAGVIYQEYSFKNINQEKTQEILLKLRSLIDKYEDNYLGMGGTVNNLYFSFDDMTFLIYRNTDVKNTGIKIRVFWNGFDAEWDENAFSRTKKRFEKKMKE